MPDAALSEKKNSCLPFRCTMYSVWTAIFFICKYIFDYFMSFVAHVMNQKSAFVVSF